MKIEFYHQFKARNSVQSACHIRALISPSRPLVIVCSQVYGHNGHPLGWSISNAFEDIYVGVIKQLRRLRFEQQLEDLKNIFQNTKSLWNAAAAILLYSLQKPYPKLDLKGVIWLEHLPENKCVLSKTGYCLVHTTNGSKPSWTGVEDLNELADEFGYDLEDLEKDHSHFRLPTLIFKPKSPSQTIPPNKMEC